MSYGVIEHRGGVSQLVSVASCCHVCHVVSVCQGETRMGRISRWRSGSYGSVSHLGTRRVSERDTPLSRAAVAVVSCQLVSAGTAGAAPVGVIRPSLAHRPTRQSVGADTLMRHSSPTLPLRTTWPIRGARLECRVECRADAGIVPYGWTIGRITPGTLPTLPVTARRPLRRAAYHK